MQLLCRLLRYYCLAGTWTLRISRASHAGQVATLFSRSSARVDPGDVAANGDHRRKINSPKMNLFEDGEATKVIDALCLLLR